LLYAFTGALLGGITSPVGAVIGGLVVGVTENLVGTYLIASQLKLTVALALIVLVLVFKPNGLFGTAIVRRGWDGKERRRPRTPDRQCRTWGRVGDYDLALAGGSGCDRDCCGVAVLASELSRFRADDGDDLCRCRTRSQHPDRLQRPDLARPWRVLRRWRLHRRHPDVPLRRALLG